MKLCRRSGIGKFSAHVSYCCKFCFTQNKAKEGRGKERRESGKDGPGGGCAGRQKQPGAARVGVGSLHHFPASIADSAVNIL